MEPFSSLKSLVGDGLISLTHTTSLDTIDQLSPSPSFVVEQRQKALDALCGVNNAEYTRELPSSEVFAAFAATVLPFIVAKPLGVAGQPTLSAHNQDYKDILLDATTSTESTTIEGEQEIDNRATLKSSVFVLREIPAPISPLAAFAAAQTRDVLMAVIELDMEARDERLVTLQRRRSLQIAADEWEAVEARQAIIDALHGESDATGEMYRRFMMDLEQQKNATRVRETKIAPRTTPITRRDAIGAIKEDMEEHQDRLEALMRRRSACMAADDWERCEAVQRLVEECHAEIDSAAERAGQIMRAFEAKDKKVKTTKRRVRKVEDKENASPVGPVRGKTAC